MTQPELFPPADPRPWQPVDDPSAPRIWLRPNFLSAAEASALYQHLRAGVPWRQDSLTTHGKTHPIPRLHQWFADGAAAYTWSGLTMEAQPWTPRLLDLRQRIQTATRRRFHSALLNYYRDGQDTVGWHADDEAELGPAPFIASVSLGAARDFALRRNQPRGDAFDRLTVALPHGSLLVMTEGVQTTWQHALPRRKRLSEGRINLTFRPLAS